MSAIRDPATITKTGRQMVTAGGDITYTKAVLYGQDISHLTKEQVEGLTSIGDPLVTVPIGISDKNDDGNGTTVVLEATFQNSNLKADLPYKAVGFFAKKDDGDEKLVLVGVATDGAYLAATSPDGVSTDSLDIKIAVAVGDASNVTAVVDPAGSVTPATLNGAISKATHDLTDKINTKADKTDLDSQIGIVTKSVSDLSATVKSNKDDTDKVLATKADKATVESDLATKASQSDLDKTNAKVATKADSEDVNAQLATKANSKDVNDALALKDDTADVDDKISNVTKSVSDLSATVTANKKATDSTLATKADKTALDDYAKSADVASDVKTLTDSIATKADAKTVNDAISKIDFTPYAKSADVDSKLKGYTDTADLTKLLAGKADSDFSYSKAELDKKLLDLTTTTGGKVDASQVATMIENKADKSDVTKQIGTVTDLVNTKANNTDVTAALDKKDDITDVDAKIKKVTDLANKAQSTADSKVKSNWAIDNSNGKFVAANVPAVDTATQSFTQTGLDLLNTLATKSQVADAKNTANQAIDDYNKRPVIRGNDGDDLLAYKTNQLRLYVDVKNCKNLPPASNTRWFTVEYIFENPNGDGVAIFRSPASEVWLNGNNGGNYNNWLRLANAGDITNLQNAINTKANSSDVYSKSEVDSKTTTKIVTGYDIPSKTRQTISAGVSVKWLVDPSVIDIVADQINQLKGRRTIDTPDFNSLTDGGSYYITNPQGGKNGPTGSWGNLFVSNGNGHRISQLFFPDDGSSPWVRELDESTWHNWIQLSTKQDVNNATNLANAASNKVDTVLANSYVRKQGMDANGNCIEIKHTGIKQANGGYAFDMWSDDWTASKLQDVIKNQLPSKADKSQVNVSGNLFNRMTDDSTWKAITGVDNTDNAILTSIRDDSPSGGNTTGGNGSAIAFGGGDTKGVLSVGWSTPHAVIAGGNGTAPVWHEEIAWKSDINNVNNQINSTNQTVSALQQTIKTLNDTINSANATIKTLQDTITGLQTQVSNQANEIKQLQETTIKGKTFSKSQEAAAEAWEKQNSQQIAFILDN